MEKHKYIKKILNKTTGLFRYIYDNKDHLKEEFEDVENLKELDEKANLFEISRNELIIQSIRFALDNISKETIKNKKAE